MAKPTASLKSLSATALISFAQTAIGCGTGMLLLGKLGRKAQRITALALIGAGAAAAVPALLDSVGSHLQNQTARGQRRRLSSIRDDAGFPEDADVY